MSFSSRVRHEADYACVAVQFLTRLPVPQIKTFEPVFLDRSVAYFPLAGLFVGAISAATFVTGCELWSAPVAAIMAVSTGVLTTGAFHEDGLADTADGLGGGQNRDQRLAIMKDSRIGTYGSCALLLALGLKVACLAGMTPGEGAAALIGVHASARVVPVVASLLVPYGGDLAGSKVPPITGTPRRALFAMATGLAPLVILSPDAAVLAALAGGLAASWLLSLAMRSIGGQTGDILGAAEQLYEVAALLALAASA